MKPIYPSALLTVLLLAGCATRRVPETFPENSPVSTETPAGPITAPVELGHHNPESSPEGEMSKEAGHDHHRHTAPKSPDTSPHSGHAAHPTDEHSPPPKPTPQIYSCPMHPEVTTKEPGICPKCGMKFEENP